MNPMSLLTLPPALLADAAQREQREAASAAPGAHRRLPWLLLAVAAGALAGVLGWAA